MSKWLYIIVFLVYTSCETRDHIDIIEGEVNLLDALANGNSIEDGIIACAASAKNDRDMVNIYFYPEEGASNFRLYESHSNIPDSKDFSKYIRNDSESAPFFNGALRFFHVNSNATWFTVVYDLAENVKLATPIKNKNKSQPSLWTSDLEIDQQESKMPLFTWDTKNKENNAIFFQVLANETLDLLSGTYTKESKFQYYKLNNVVLNITQNTPPELVSGNSYIFTVMDVSIDNWVNEVIMKTFIIK